MENETTSELGCNHTDAWDWVYSMQPAYMSVICFFGVLGNSLVLCVFCLQPRPASVADVYLSNLAVADLLMVSCLPFWVVAVTNRFHWTFGEPMCRLVGTVIGMNYQCSVLFLTLVSVDRYLVLTRPLTRGRRRRAFWARAICLGVWVAGISLSFPAVLFRSVRFFPHLGISACYLAYPHEGWRLRYNVSVAVVGFLVPVPVVSFCSYHIAKAVCHSRKLRRGGGGAEGKAARLVLAVLAAFVLCWLPYQLLTFLDTLDHYQVISGCTWAHVLDIGEQLATYLGYSNSALNPFLYAIVGKHFRQRAREAFGAARRRRRRPGPRPRPLNADVASSKHTGSTRM
ncbi:B2 bradykinin receptor-like [Betta splendens]|uniref:B1 bradykinin receptor n=1 Tax=Betta splendens TaxID=158456 RepID=A0A6P7LM07_BETSP|nr:B2 bradykinin receptor-like [Betta splendens]